jgi:signal transduction histidine kinase
MSANDLLAASFQIFFVVIGILTITDYLRHRDVIRRDIALMFGALALSFLIQDLINVINVRNRWLSALPGLTLASQPYLLLRLVRYFQPIPTAVMRTAFISMIIVWVGIILADSLMPVWVIIATLAAIAYFVVVNGYSMLVFVRGAFTAAGVDRHRLRLAAAGSGLLALALVWPILALILPDYNELLGSLMLLTATLAGLSYYGAFAPPRWLRRTWQFAELWNVLARVTSTPVTHRFSKEEILAQLCESANKSVGGMASAVIQQNSDEDAKWTVHNPLKSPVVSDAENELLSVAKPAWGKTQTLALSFSKDLNGIEHTLLERVQSRTVLIAPLVNGNDTWGMLFTFLPYMPLFLDDDLSLLELLANQSALLLENSALVEKLNRYNVELEQKTSQLNATNQELESFSYSVSHDLRAPLRALDGFSQALQDDYAHVLDAEGQDFLSRIRAASQRMGHLIDDLLMLSQLTRTEMCPETVDLSALVQQIAADLRESDPARPIDFLIQSPLNGHGDPRLLRVMLNNLVGNAWKFTSKTPDARIEFGMICQDETPVYFVRDNGVGFDMAYANKLFGAFQRLHKTTEFEGTGIGLATVQRIIHRHGGRIWAESAVGNGATFYFTL